MKVLSGSQAIAEAVKLCKPKVIAAYPITPATPIAETLAQMVADGELDAEYINVESEHSAMSACIGAEATGVRTFTATASQGLALMHEMLFVASGLRLPIIMAVANRALSSPLNIWNDQQDSFAQRDSGWMQFYVENAQEAFDTIIIAYKVAEEMKIPAMVCLDGYVISHTYENIELLNQSQVNKFLPEFKPEIFLDPNKPMTLGPVGTPECYMEFKKQQQDALMHSIETIRKVSKEFAKLSGRSYGNSLIETIGIERKKHVLITIGSITGTARALQKELDFGIIKVKALRPFPTEELAEACKNADSIGVIEKDISLGANGALYDEVRSTLYGKCSAKISGFIAGLGGRDITVNNLKEILKTVKKGKEVIKWIC